MKRILILALFGVLSVHQPVSAQGYGGGAGMGPGGQDPGELVGYWYERFLNRPPDPGGMNTWARNLVSGMSPQDAVARIIGSQEYYNKCGDNPAGFAHALFLDVAGRQPSPRDFAWVMGRLSSSGSEADRADVARTLLSRYPQAIYPPAGGQQPGGNFDPRGNGPSPGYSYGQPGWSYRR
jgi:hypothetical protein